MAAHGEPRDRDRTLVGWVAAAIVLTVLLVIVGFATSPLYDRPTNPPAGLPTGGVTLTVSEIVSNSALYEGQEVAVSGQVVETIAPRAIRIVDPGSGGEQSLLVLAARSDALGSSVAGGDVVQVAGTVRRLFRDQMGEELGVDLDDRRFAPFEGKPVLLARSASKP